jgi:hypothetical protein
VTTSLFASGRAVFADASARNQADSDEFHARPPRPWPPAPRPSILNLVPRLRTASRRRIRATGRPRGPLRYSLSQRSSLVSGAQRASVDLRLYREPLHSGGARLRHEKPIKGIPVLAGEKHRRQPSVPRYSAAKDRTCRQNRLYSAVDRTSPWEQFELLDCDLRRHHGMLRIRKQRHRDLIEFPQRWAGRDRKAQSLKKRRGPE